MKKEVKGIIFTILFFVLFVGFLYCVKNIDVDSIGPNGGKVGLSHINKQVFDKFGQDPNWDKISDYILYGAMATVAIFALIGLKQLIQRKSLLKIDADIYLLAAFYVVVVGVYVAFDKVIINCRPIVTDEGIEASFPSSHTLITLCFLATTMIQVANRVKNKAIKVIIDLVCIACIVVMSVARLKAGMHWFSDVVGAILLGMFLVMLYYSLYSKIKSNKRESSSLSFSNDMR